MSLKKKSRKSVDDAIPNDDEIIDKDEEIARLRRKLAEIEKKDKKKVKKEKTEKKKMKGKKDSSDSLAKAVVPIASSSILQKASSPILVTEPGMVTVFTACLSTPHVSHEHSPSLSQEGRDTIVVVPSGMLKCPSALTLAAAAAAMLSARGLARVQMNTRL